jgi:hypothetical protein
MNEIYKKILELAVYAPSGDNMQPWNFQIKNQALYVYNDPKKDPTLYNFKQRAALISHGALLENISIIAPSLGFSAVFNYVPDPTNPNLTAVITLNPASTSQHPLLHFIKKRHTNRKPYKASVLKEEYKEAILNIFQHSQNVSISLIENSNDVGRAAAAVCQGDRMIFENKAVHDFLFSHIRWTEQEELKLKNGLYLKTMELAPPQVAAFKLFKNWGVMKAFNFLGFPKMAVKSNFKLYTQGSALVALIISNHEPVTYLELGRRLQRLWLTATSLDLNIHPLTGVPFLMQRIAENQAQNLENYQIELLKKSYAVLHDACGAGNNTIGFFCRLGHADPPSGLSSRLTPEIEITN